MKKHSKTVNSALNIDDPAAERLVLKNICRIVYVQSASPRQASKAPGKKLKNKIHFMKIKNTIDQHCKQLHLSALAAQVQHLADAAAAEGISYLEFAGRLLEAEIASRNRNEMLRKIKFARLPAMHDLQAYDCAQAEGMPPAKLQIKKFQIFANINNALINNYICN